MPKDTSFSLAVTCMTSRKFGSVEHVDVSDQFVRNGSSLSTYTRVAVQTPKHKPDGPLPCHVPLASEPLNFPVP